MKPLFELGQVVGTPGALEAIQRNQESPKHSVDVTPFLDRHITGDWGDVCDEDKEANNQALKDGDRIFSAYTLSDDTKIWIITEADRSSTCVLLPEEY